MSLPRTTLEQWAVLAAVIDEGGFAQAAKRLNKSQSAVSYALSHLQESLGVELLIIEGRKAALTAHGRVLLARARSVLRDGEALERLAKSMQQGWEAKLELVVDVAFPRPRLLSIIAELQSSCPDTEVSWSEVVLSGAEDAITGASADLIVTSRVPPGFLGEKLLAVEFVAVAHPAHPLFALQRELDANDLLSHVQAVVRDSGKTPRDEGWLGAPRRFTVSSMEAALASVLAALSFAWLPQHMIAAPIESGALKALPLSVGGTRTVSLFLVLAHPEAQGPALKSAVASFKR